VGGGVGPDRVFAERKKVNGDAMTLLRKGPSLGRWGLRRREKKAQFTARRGTGRPAEPGMSASTGG